MLASTSRLCGSADETNYTEAEASGIPRAAELTLRNHDVAAERAHRERRAAVAEGRAHRSVVHAALPAGVARAANRQRQVRANAAAEGVRRQLASRRGRQDEPHRARIHVPVVDRAAA